MNKHIKVKKDEVIRSRITKEFKNKIREYANINNLTMSEVIEKALKELLEK